MGLDIAVGLLARAVAEGEEDEAADWDEAFDELNALLGEAGHEPHREPRSISDDLYFEAQMWGYSGLHRLRRLAAWHALERRLPSPLRPDDDQTEDAVLERLNSWIDRQRIEPAQGLIGRLLGRGRGKAPFQHLLWHSDCEGFYLPRDFQDVIVAADIPGRRGADEMVGSSVRLLGECRVLARAIELPEGIDPEDEALLDAAEAPGTDGPLWQRYGVEAFCLARLIRGCERSIAAGGVLAFV